MSKVIKGMFGDYIEDEPQDYAAFPVGSRVQIKHDFVDYFPFRGDETGIVVKNDGRYLSIIVQFDVSLWVRGNDDAIWEKTDHNFDPHNLILLALPQPTPNYIPGLHEVWDY